MVATALTPLPDTRQPPVLSPAGDRGRGQGWRVAGGRGTGSRGAGSRGPGRQGPRRYPWVVSGLLMAVLGLWRVGDAGFWGDELATWGMTRVGWRTMWALLGERDIVLAPYYALMHGWASLFGDSDAALRLPSVLAMTAAASLIAVLGTRLANPRVGLLSGVLFAVLPTSSRYAQEASPYAMGTFAAVLATLLLTRAVGRPSRARFAAYAGAVALLGAMHVVALALLAAHGLALLVSRPDLWRRWVLAAVVGGLPGLALLWFGSHQKKQISWIERADLAAPLRRRSRRRARHARGPARRVGRPRDLPAGRDRHRPERAAAGSRLAAARRRPPVNLPALRAAGRIARRDAMRAPGRSILVVAMIALPILGLTAADVLFRTDQLSATEKIDRELGPADALIGLA